MAPELKKKLAVFIIVGILIVAVFAGAFFLYSLNNPLVPAKIGWITDIHAGDDGVRKQTEKNIVYPDAFQRYLSAALSSLRSDGIEAVVFGGDQVNEGQGDFAETLARIVQEAEIQPIWTKGNHDQDKFEIMRRLGAPADYYFVDLKRIRVIVLDNSDVSSYRNGSLSAEQFEWFKKVLRETPRKSKVIVSTHVPIFENDDGSNAIFPRYVAFEKEIRESGKVIMVLSGHSHAQYHAVINGIDYWIGNPLTLKDHMGSYYVIDTNKKTVELRNVAPKR